ncbi:hypothetical protein D9M70_545110 [compost metagenome]
MQRAFLARPKAIASSVAVSQACSAVTTSICAGSSLACADSATVRFRNDMRPKPSCCASARERSTNSLRVSMP